MAEIIWTESALSDLDAIADYIALDKPEAAHSLVRKVDEGTGQKINSRFFGRCLRMAERYGPTV
jgi:hypothetical protein